MQKAKRQQNKTLRRETPAIQICWIRVTNKIEIPTFIIWEINPNSRWGYKKVKNKNCQTLMRTNTFGFK